MYFWCRLLSSAIRSPDKRSCCRLRCVMWACQCCRALLWMFLQPEGIPRPSSTASDPCLSGASDGVYFLDFAIRFTNWIVEKGRKEPELACAVNGFCFVTSVYRMSCIWLPDLKYYMLKCKCCFTLSHYDIPLSPLWLPNNFGNPLKYPECCVEEPSLGHQSWTLLILKKKSIGTNTENNINFSLRIQILNIFLTTVHCTMCYCSWGQMKTTNLCSLEVESQGPDWLDESLAPAQYHLLLQLAVS